jgi:hypothetical protein
MVIRPGVPSPWQKVFCNGMEGRTMTRSITSTALWAALLFPASGGALAVPVLDQSQQVLHVLSGFNFGVLSPDEMAQTFTVGVEGTLTEIQVFAGTNGPEGDFIFELRSTTGAGIPVSDGSPPLASIVRSDFLSRDWQSFDLTPFGIEVNPGQVLAIVLGGAASWDGADCTEGEDHTPAADCPPSGDRYAGGAGFFRVGGGAFEQVVDGADTGGDFAFRSFVECRGDACGGIPEPSTLSLLAIASLPFLRIVRRGS